MVADHNKDHNKDHSGRHNKGHNKNRYKVHYKDRSISEEPMLLARHGYAQIPAAGAV